jgi:hypothetical protein
VNRTTTSAPAAAAGVDPTDASTLTLFDSDQDEHLDIPATTVRLRRPFGDRSELTGAYFYSHAHLGYDLDRRIVGTRTTAGRRCEQQLATGNGDAHLDTHVADVGTTYGSGSTCGSRPAIA